MRGPGPLARFTIFCTIRGREKRPALFQIFERKRADYSSDASLVPGVEVMSSTPIPPGSLTPNWLETRFRGTVSSPNLPNCAPWHFLAISLVIETKRRDGRVAEGA